MSSRGSGISQTYQDIAAVLETLESTDQEITTATPVEDELLDAESVSVDIGVRIPFLEDSLEEIPSNSKFTPTDVRLQDDGTLHVDLQATVVQDAEQPDSRQGAPPVQGTEDTDTDAEPNATKAPATDDQQRSDHTPTATATPSVEIAEHCEKSETESNDEDSSSDDPDNDGAEDAPTLTDGESIPAYQDPAQLRAVYDEYDTFAAMTEALDVDVTPQTVRRYMIEHGIHQPASTTGSRPAETLLNTDPDMALSSDDKATTDTDGSESATSETQAKQQSPSQRVGDGGQSLKPNGSQTQADQSQSEAPATDADSTVESTEGSTQNSGISTEAAVNGDERGEEASSVEAADCTGAESEQTAVDGNYDSQPINEQAVAAAINLPSHLTLTDVKEVVQTAETLYEAQQQLEVDRERARELLQELNLLEFVHGRLANREGNPSMDKIERRIYKKSRRIPAAVASG